MTTFHRIVEAALAEYDPHAGKYRDHYEVRNPAELADMILTHMVAFGLARAEAEEAEIPRPETIEPAWWPRFGLDS